MVSLNSTVSCGTTPMRGAQRCLRDVADVLPVDGHAAARHVVEAQQDARHRRLAGARGADDRHHLAGRHLEGEAVQDDPLGLVAELHVLEADGAARYPERHGARAVRHLRRLGQHVHHALDVGQRLLDLAIDHAHEVERNEQLQHQRVDHHEVADGLGAGGDVVARHHHAGGQRDGEDRRPGRR